MCSKNNYLKLLGLSNSSVGNIITLFYFGIYLYFFSKVIFLYKSIAYDLMKKLAP